MTDLSETPYRIYTLGEKGEPECLHSCDEFSLAESLHHAAKIKPVRGIMWRPVDGEPGIWLVKPWA